MFPELLNDEAWLSSVLSTSENSMTYVTWVPYIRDHPALFKSPAISSLIYDRKWNKYDAINLIKKYKDVIDLDVFLKSLFNSDNWNGADYVDLFYKLPKHFSNADIVSYIASSLDEYGKEKWSLDDLSILYYTRTALQKDETLSAAVINVFKNDDMSIYSDFLNVPEMQD